MKIVWAGVRGYGRRFFKDIAESEDCQVVGCFHPESEVAAVASEMMQCLPFTDYDGMLMETQADAAILTVPNHLHYEMVHKALTAGLHVLVEKPLTNTVAEGEELVDLAERNSRVLAVGHNYRFFGYVQIIKKQLEAGAIGQVVAAEMNMGHGGGLKFRPHQWRYHHEKCPGGPLNMLGTHQIDAANYLFGAAKSYIGTVKNLCADTTAADMSLVQIEYQSGVTVAITNLYNSVSTEFINIYGTKGALRFNRWPEICLWFQPKDVDCDCAPYRPLEIPEVNTAKVVFEEFSKSLRGVNTRIVLGDEALKTVRIMESVLK